MCIETIKLEKLFRQHFSEEVHSTTPLKGDGSERRIYRIGNAHRSVIGIVGDHRAENEAFLKFSRYFRTHDLPVPEIYAQNLSHGTYLEQDLGPETLFEWMTRTRANDGFSSVVMAAYRCVLEWLPKFQITAGRSLDYSYCYQHSSFAWDSMRWDLEYFRQRFLEIFYRGKIDQDALQKDMDHLVHHLLEEKADYFLYRDFQSRNVMMLNGRPHFIDYQSGRRGALQYDVASLLYDAKANIPKEARADLLQHYLDSVVKIESVDVRRFMHYFPGFVLIRIMQALGAYGYLAAVKGKHSFLKSVPYALANIEQLMQERTILDDMPELHNVFINLVRDESLHQI
jgi:aminoglycoside/choline kinase family phosphotransferase